MAFKGVDHVVVRVNDLQVAVESYNKMLGIEPRLAHSDALKADQAFYDFENGTFLELITPTDPSSPIAGPLEKRGEGIHTIAFAVDNQAATASELTDNGVKVLGGAFVHPGSAHGVLVQLSERS
ncbi:MAG: methylmalonyl-CoA epimerase [Chromatiales bacterium]|jgi:methylmalonyl-CoA/ethylmalonyl-CoA epimerase|nr:methylmalonyl-CoA epimerase [Chromatiales bacterium]